MKTILIIAVISFFTWNVHGQSAKELLRNGQRNKSGEFYFNQNMECYFKDDSPEEFFELPDSVIVEVPSKYVVFLKAYNPLHISHQTESKLVPDQINQIAIDFWENLPSQFSNLKDIEDANEKQIEESARRIKVIDEKIKANEANFLNISRRSKTLDSIVIKAKENELIDKLKATKKTLDGIVTDGLAIKLSNQLIKLKFIDAVQTRSEVTSIRTKTDKLKLTLSAVYLKLDSLRKETLKLRDKQDWISNDWKNSDALYRISIELTNLVVKHQKIGGNLEGLLNRVETTMETWKIFEKMETIKNESHWYIGIKKEGNLEKKSITVITLKKIVHPVTINGDQIVVAPDLITKVVTFRLRKRQVVVFEASAGLAFSPQDQSDFVTAKNDAGELIIGKAASKQMEQLNITSMLNLNFNVWDDETVLPFLQLGAGLNEAIPLALLGAGLRFDFGGKRIFALSGGMSFTGVKALINLDIGSEVKDDLTLQNDLEYQISTPKLYFGIQYNF